MLDPPLLHPSASPLLLQRTRPAKGRAGLPLWWAGLQRHVSRSRRREGDKYCPEATRSPACSCLFLREACGAGCNSRSAPLALQDLISAGLLEAFLDVGDSILLPLAALEHGWQGASTVHGLEPAAAAAAGGSVELFVRRREHVRSLQLLSAGSPREERFSQTSPSLKKLSCGFKTCWPSGAALCSQLS